jgi:phenylalanyl-tRNA synthetase beta chain
MRVSYNWLKEYVDIGLPPEKLAGALTMSGLSIEGIEKKGSDSILEAEITSNRPDWLSMIGVAREVAAITGKRLKIPEVKKARTREAGGKSRTSDVKVRVEEKKLCPRYTARMIRNVKVGESPLWLKERIESAGLRPVNNIVDITNFCMFETGEPMHAFDLDKMSGRELVVRCALKGEKIKTIEGEEKELNGSILVIADRDKPIAIAGVMGGLNTEVTAGTKNILLEAAYFDPVSVRRTARTLGISTDSSYRFERRVDPENIICSSDRAAALIADLALGEIGEIFDIGKEEKEKRRITLRTSRLNKVLGLAISKRDTAAILGSLGLKAVSSSGDKTVFAVPSSRYDLKDEIDLIEEVARIYGYDRIQETLPSVTGRSAGRPFNIRMEDRIREVLSSLGANEIITYGLLGKKTLTMSASAGQDTVEVKNPLSAEQEAMRPDLITGMLGVVSWNVNRRSYDLKLFELGNIYRKTKAGSFKERAHLAIGVSGSVSCGWAAPQRSANLFDLKGLLENIFSAMGVDGVSFLETDDRRFSRSASAAVAVKGVRIGVAGQISGRVAKNFDIKEKIFATEIDMETLFKHIKLEKTFRPLPRYPSVLRDISIVTDKKTENLSILSSIKESGAPALKEARLIDVYSGRQIPDGKIGLTYRLEYQDPARTLEEKDVNAAHSRILRALEEKFGAKLR